MIPASDTTTVLTPAEHGALRVIHEEISHWHARAQNFHAAAALDSLEKKVTAFAGEPSEELLREIEFEALLGRAVPQGRYAYQRRAVHQACQHLFRARAQPILAGVAERVVAAVRTEQAWIAEQEAQLRVRHRDLLPAQVGAGERFHQLAERLARLGRLKEEICAPSWSEFPPDVEWVLAALAVPFSPTAETVVAFRQAA